MGAPAGMQGQGPGGPAGAAGPAGPAGPGGPGGMQAAQAGGAGADASCATGATGGSGAAGAPRQEFGKKGARVEVLALLPITHGCHVTTEAELKKAYKAHPDEIHLTIVDLFGPEGQKLANENGGQRALVLVNGKSQFKVGRRQGSFERQEGDAYQTSDIVPVVEQAVKAS